MALARALVIQPRILLLDEPLSNLDAKLREEMQIELRQIQRTVGTTTILVTHDQAEAMALSDRIVVMNQGRAEQIGPPHEAYERPATPFVASFLGKTNVLRRGSRHGVVRSARAPGPRRCAVALRPSCGRRRSLRRDRRLPARSRRASSRATTGSSRSTRPPASCTVIRQNTGEPMPAEGETVRLAWRRRGHGRCRRRRRRRMSREPARGAR